MVNEYMRSYERFKTRQSVVCRRFDAIGIGWNLGRRLAVRNRTLDNKFTPVSRLVRKVKQNNLVKRLLFEDFPHVIEFPLILIPINQ